MLSFDDRISWDQGAISPRVPEFLDAMAQLTLHSLASFRWPQMPRYHTADRLSRTVNRAAMKPASSANAVGGEFDIVACAGGLGCPVGPS